MTKNQKTKRPAAEDAQADRPARRNRLISLMLQDRGVVRLVTAPHGFGKTMLAREYAARLFAGKEVCWVDASQPDFLIALDEGGIQGVTRSGEVPALVVIDDLPWLHEQRLQKLATFLDKLLVKGVEVVVTTLPSTDCLHDVQPDCLFIGASDMLVTESELFDAHGGSLAPEAKALALRDWRRARRLFMGRAAAVVWSDDPQDEAKRCLRGFFEERLPASFFACAFSVLVLGKGSFGELERLETALGSDDRAILAREYPFLGIDTGAAKFDVGDLAPELLAVALEGTEPARQVLGGTVPLAERAIALLFDRGEVQRAESLLSLFCADKHCAAWLVSRGWELLDQGHYEVVERLLSRCQDDAFSELPRLRALRAWACGLQGDELEACHLAQQVFGPSGAAGADEPETTAQLAAYLALAAFGSGATAVHGKGTYAAAQSPVTPGEFLASVVDLCTDTEVRRALIADGSQQQGALEKLRQPPSERRVRALVALFTEYHDRFQASLPYRLALHLLEYVDSPELRKLLRSLGCDIVIAMRRDGLRSFSEALLVRDLWKNGYFGVGAPDGGQRDMVLLEAASRMLKMLAKERRARGADVPWEVDGHLYQSVGEQPARVQARGTVELMHVRLFGCFEVTIGERLINDNDLRKKSRLMLTLLVISQGRDVPRDVLLEDLWPESARLRALDNFYTVWGNLVMTVGEGPYLERVGDFCRVNTHYVVSDVGEFECLCRKLLVSNMQPRELLDTYAHLESLYKGDLLPSEVGNKRVDAQRVRYKALFADSMVAASSCALGMDDARLALWFARKGMEVDSKREDTYFALMKAQIAAGQRCGAIRTYFECRKFLSDELGLDPSRETKGLYDQLISIDPTLLKLDPKTFRI